jgi:hypothetical protein
VLAGGEANQIAEFTRPPRFGACTTLAWVLLPSPRLSLTSLRRYGICPKRNRVREPGELSPGCSWPPKRAPAGDPLPQGADGKPC